MPSNQTDPVFDISPNTFAEQPRDRPDDQHHAPELQVVIAPDSFKGSISAADAAAAIGSGWHRVRPADVLHEVPLADGGEGTLDAIAAARPDGIMHQVTGLTGPDGREVTARWLQLGEQTAVIEMAAVCGLPMMATLDPLGATTRGLGELIAAALDAGARTVIVGAGGSATTDGGAGALAALGLELLDSSGRPIADGGAALSELRTVRGTARHPDKLIMLSDVDAPLLGDTGAAAVFGPQKGADAGQIELLDAALRQFAIALGGSHDLPGMGAAGGLGYGLVAGLGGQIVAGAPYLSQLAGLDQTIATADVVITGEGRFDQTSLGGKVVGHVFDLLAQQAPEPVEGPQPPKTPEPVEGPQPPKTPEPVEGPTRVVIAGQIALNTSHVRSYSLTDLAGSTEAAIADPAHWLNAAGSRAAAEI